MIVCRECGNHNPAGATFCENRVCGSFLEWSGEAFPTETVPAAQPAHGPGWGNSGVQRVGPSEVGLTVRLPERELSVDPGDAVSCEVTLENTGRVVDQYAIQVFGEAAGWSVVEPGSVNLVPEAKGSVQVTFRPPRRPDVVAGTKPFRIVATSRQDLRTTTFADGTIAVSPFHEMAAYLRSPHGAGRSAVYDAVVENRGNAPFVAQVAAVDERQALELTVSAPVFSVPPGRSGVARVQARPGARPAAGQPTAYPFRVTAQVGSEPSRSMDGQFVYKPALPSVGRNWLPMLRIVLTLLGGLLMILGATGPWIDDVAGTELTYEGYVERVFGGDVASPPEGVSTTFVAVGLVAIVLGVLALLGLFSKTGLPTRMAGVLALVLTLIFAFTATDADVSLGSGPYVVMFGALVALIGGIAGRSSG